MDSLNQIQSLGLTLPSMAYVIGAVVFSLLGMVAYWYGKRAQKTTTKWLGVALMFYAYGVSETWQLYAVGLALCLAIWWERDS